MNDDALYPISDGEKYGYKDAAGKFIIEPQFKHANRFSEGLAAVEINGKWGFIDKKGEVIIKPRWNREPRPFIGGAAVVIGNREAPSRFTGFGVFYPSRLCYGYIDRTGKILVEPRLTQARDFDQGVAVIAEGRGRHMNLFQAIGNILRSLVPVIGGSIYATDIEEKWGHINLKGEYVAKPKFDHGYAFHNGVANVTLKRKAGFLLLDGRFLARSQYEMIKGTGDGPPEFAPVKKNKKSGNIGREEKPGVLQELEETDLIPDNPPEAAKKIERNKK